MGAVSIEDKFLFDLQGFLVVPGVLAPAECERLLASLRQHPGHGTTRTPGRRRWVRGLPGARRASRTGFTRCA